ncbi:DUF3892 domain-containing protein [Legionella longbeachae]|nr:DUF3892 domain-containing protein [Legionella longbeachae]UAK48319.1 DUF3892 domain-containing protein [Legionella longbeachae]
MLTSYEITCIKKSGSLLSQNKHITHVDIYTYSIHQVITIQQAIQMIE